MYDARPVNTHFNEPTLLVGRFLGAGASVPTPIANVKDSAATRCTITRSAVGNLVVTFTDTPLGVVQSYDFWVASPANNKNISITPPTVGSYAFTLLCSYHANGVNVDISSSEELVFEVWTARTQVP